MSSNNSQSEATWKKKVKTYLMYGVAIALVIWFISTAFGAKNLARENRDRLLTPHYDASYVVGGPERFSEPFGEVENAEVDNINVDSYLWSTLVMKNKGYAEGQNLEILINTITPAEKVLVTPPGWGNDVEVSLNEQGTQTTVNMDSFSDDENTYIFLAMNPEDIQVSDKKQWVHEFDAYLEKVTIESDNAEAIIHGKGYSGYLQ